VQLYPYCIFRFEVSVVHRLECSFNDVPHAALRNMNSVHPVSRVHQQMHTTELQTVRCCVQRSAVAQSVQRLATGCTVRGSNPGWRGEIFCTRPNRPWGPRNLLYDGYRVYFPGVKRPGRDVDHPPHLVPRLKKK